MIDFWKDKERLQRLAGVMIFEDEQEDHDNELSGIYDREQQVERHVMEVFNKLGIALTDGVNVLYNSLSKEVIVILDDTVDGFSIDQLSGLYQSEMSDDYKIRVHDQLRMEVVFKWSGL